ncbi:unnamed protein product [Choristocarpus tenellus]
MGNPTPRSNTCTVQGALQQFFQVAQILWTVTIAYVLHEVTTKLRMYHPREQIILMRKFHMLVWGVAAVGMLLPFTTSSYGTTGAWCWIAATTRADFDAGTLWRYGAFYFPLWLVIIYNINLYVRIAQVLRRFSVEIDVGRGSKQESSVSPPQEQQDRMRKFGKRLFWYPAVMIFCWTFPTINRIQNTLDPNNPIFTLLLLQVIREQIPR